MDSAQVAYNLFRGRVEGGLTAKQTSWLFETALREHHRRGPGAVWNKHGADYAGGTFKADDGQVVNWDLRVYPNGAGYFNCRWTTADEAERENERAITAEYLREVNAKLTALLGAGDRDGALALCESIGPLSGFRS